MHPRLRWKRDRWVAINFDLVHSFDAKPMGYDKEDFAQEIFALRLSYSPLHLDYDDHAVIYYIVEKDVEYINDYLRGEGKLHKGY